MSMIRKNSDQVVTAVKKERVLFAAGIRLSCGVEPLMLQCLRLTICLEAGAGNRAEAIGAQGRWWSNPFAQRSGPGYRRAQCSSQTDECVVGYAGRAVFTGKTVRWSRAVMITGHQHSTAAGTVVIDFHPAPQRLGFRLVKFILGATARDAER